MGRRCCVLNCTSTGTTPSHKFPKDPQRHEKWLKNLILKPSKEIDVSKLRVCYKHFKESDYSGSPKIRTLIHAAVPSMIKTDTCTKQIKNIEELSEKQAQVNDQTTRSNRNSIN